MKTKVSGVYCLRNTRNNKQYVGSALDIIARWKDHRLRLKTDTHANSHLQRAWNLYGNVFRLSIIERCLPQKCLEREQHWIDRYNATDRNKGYNINPTAGSRLGVRLSKEKRRQFSKTAKEAMNRPEVKRKLAKKTRQAMESLELRRLLSEKARQRPASSFSRGKQHSQSIRRARLILLLQQVKQLRSGLPVQFHSKDLQVLRNYKYRHNAQTLIRKLLCYNLIERIRKDNKRQPALYIWKETNHD